MGNQPVDERTALSEGSARYDATGLPPAVVGAMGTSAGTLPVGFALRSNRSSLSRLAIAVVSLSAAFLTAVLLSVAMRVASTPDGAASDELAAVASAATGGNDGTNKIIIPSMQPFSTVNPADAHCPHMDRPEVEMQAGRRLLVGGGGVMGVLEEGTAPALLFAQRRDMKHVLCPAGPPADVRT